MMLTKSYTIHPTDDADPRPAGPEARQLDIQPHGRATDQQIAALANALIRYQRWKRNLARAQEERILAQRAKREAAA